MAPTHLVKTEREKKLKLLFSFTSNLETRFTSTRDPKLLNDLQTQIRNLPLPASHAVTAKQEDLDRMGTELWNLSTRLRREDLSRTSGTYTDQNTERKRTLCLLRVFAFLVLDTAVGQAVKTRELRNCIRIVNVALKTAKGCLESGDLDSATRVLERLADYQDGLGGDAGVVGQDEDDVEVGKRLRVEYFALRTMLAWRQDRMDMAEHMFAKIRHLSFKLDPSTSESITDLLYEVGKGLVGKRNYEVAIRWLERAQDMLAEQDLETLSSEAGELRQNIMQAMVKAHLKLESVESQKRAWEIMSLLESDYTEKTSVSLLKLELLSAQEDFDVNQYYAVLLRMIRSVVLNDTNYRTIIHHIHKLKDRSTATACKLLDDLIEIRLFQEENQSWIEKAVITRIWMSISTSLTESSPDLLQELLDHVAQNTKHPLSPPATHAAQTLLWKRVEAAYNQEQGALGAYWCQVCLHPIFEKAGELNKSKIARKMIACALLQQDHATARQIFKVMSKGSRDEPLSRYLMYKVALRDGDLEMATECLELVCKNSSKEATLLYSCVIEAQTAGNRRMAICALGKVLDEYDCDASINVHLPALLRCTARLLKSELIRDARLDSVVVEELCKVFEGACIHARAAIERPNTSPQQSFTSSEFAWFSKVTYNLAVTHCTEMEPKSLLRLLNSCIEFITMLKGSPRLEYHEDFQVRKVYCEFLVICTLTTVARAEDNVQACLQYYLEARKHSQVVRILIAEELGKEKQEEPARLDLIAKHFQIVKLDLEAALKLKKWEDLDGLFDECWKYKNPDQYGTLADLVLTTFSCMEKESEDRSHQNKLLSVLQKIINLTWRQTNNDIVKLSRWIRCLFQLALDFDESVSLKCLEQAAQIAAARQGVSQHPPTPPTSMASSSVGTSPIKPITDGAKEINHYPATELEWLATTSFNRAMDYYLQENDAKCKAWAEKSFALAQWAEDGHVLRDLLMSKYSGLTWEK